MLRFIIGRKGAGKTKYLHRLLGEKVKSGEKAMLIVPKLFTFDSDRSVLDEMGPRYACEVEVLSFSRLAYEVMTACRGIGKPILKEGANAVLLQLAVQSVRDRLSFFAKHAESSAFINKMAAEIKAFKQDAVSPEELERASRLLPEGMLRQKAAETALIFSAYNAESAQSFFDDRDLLTFVAQILSEYDFFKDKIVAIDNFSRFSGQEMKIIERILSGAKEVYVTACTDDIMSPDASSPFASVNKTMRRVLASAKKLSVEAAQPKTVFPDGSRRAPELSHLEENLFEPLFSPYEGEAEAVLLCPASTVREECENAARKIKSLIRTGQYRCRDIAVVYRSPEPYEKELRHSLKKYGVPIFEDKRQPIQNEPLIIAVRSALSAAADGFSTDSLMRYVKTGLAGVSREEIAACENYAIMWSLSSKQWQKPWTDNPDGFGAEMTEERKERLALLNETRRKITEPLCGLRERLQEGSGRECVKAVFEFLIENGIDGELKKYAISLEETGNIELALEQERVWDILTDTLDQLAEAFGERPADAKRLLEIFDLIISTQSLGKLPDGFDEVCICSSDRIQTKNVRAAFVLGLNSGVFPLSASENGLFCENERERLREFIPELSNDAVSFASYERFLVYASLCCASERLYLSWALTDGRGGKITESPAVSSVRKILPSAKQEDALCSELSSLIESEEAAFELTAKMWNENTPQANALKLYFSCKEEYRGKIQAIERATGKKEFSFKNAETAKQLFGKNMRISASRLQTFEECPFKYFCQYGLNARPRKSASLDPASSGTLMHFVLEKLLSRHKGEQLFEVGAQLLEAEAKQLLETYIDLYMGGRKGKSERFNYLYSRTLKILKTIILRLVSEFSESDFEPCDFELDIGKDVKPFRIPLSDGYIEVKGVVDRVDKTEIDGKSYIRVVDYKTGTKSFSLSNVLCGLDMQLPLYLVSIWRGGREYYGAEVVPAGILYFPARFEPFDAERSDGKEEIEQKKLAGGKMDGLILSDGRVLRAMDRGLSGRFIPIAKNKRTDAVKGNFITLSQLGVLSKKMDEIMREMGEELHRGRVPARPAFGKNHMNTCAYCDFAGVCMREEDSPVRYLTSRTHEECLDCISEGDGDEENVDE